MSVEETKTRLKSLLQANADNPLCLTCLESLRNESSSLASGDPYPTRALLETYERRSHIPGNTLIPGFREFLANLRVFTDQELLGHSVRGDHQDFGVFTDVDFSTIIGVLKFDPPFQERR